jgi:DNA-binding SARP family transcriptional activator
MNRRDRPAPDLPPGPARDLVDLLRFLQRRSGRTNGQVAIRAGLSPGHVSDVRNGRKPPRPATAEKIAKAMGADQAEANRARMLAERWIELDRYERHQVVRAAEPAAPNPDGALRVQLLGPVSVHRAGTPIDVGGRIERALLAALALSDESGADTDELISLVWGRPGEVTRDSVYHYVGRLRRRLAALAPVMTVTSERGRYRLGVPDEAVDVRLFRQLAATAWTIRDEDADGAATRYHEALALWRGTPLADVGDRLSAARRELREERRAIVLQLASIEAGRHHPQKVVELLGKELTDDPGWESAAALVIDAFTKLGRRDEAGAVYRRARTRLAAAGLDPDERLDAAFRRALRGAAERGAADPVPVGRTDTSTHPPPSLRRRPSGLPRPDPHFTGRIDELNRLVAALSERRVCVISGMAGVGKSALAVRAAREVAPTFPDGVIFIDLHGYTVGERPLPVGDALDRLLRRDGVPGELIPSEPEERAALFAERLADREILLVLDNAHDAAQIRPLLPTGGRCAVVVTSRMRLAALDDAESIPLDVLSHSEATALFRTVVGPDRLVAGADTDRLVTQIVISCGRLPLAVRIAAGRHRLSGPRPLEDLATSLADVYAALDELDDDDRSVTASLRVSFADLAPELARMLLLAARHSAADLDGYAAAALLDRSRTEAGRLLDRLVDRHLLLPVGPGRFWFHDLTLAFARHTADRSLGPEDRTPAVQRLTAYYLRAVALADTQITPHRHQVALDVADCEAALPPLTDYETALRWLETEQVNLAGACVAAHSAGLDGLCWQLAFTLRGFYFLTKNVQPWTATHEVALASAERSGDRLAQALIVNNLGLARLEQGHDVAAADHYRRAWRLFSEVGDAHGETTARANLVWLHYSRRRFADFLAEIEPVLAFYESTGAERSAAITRRGIGLAATELDQPQRAIFELHAARSTFDRLGLRLDTAMTWNGLGEAYQRDGQVDRAIEAFEAAIQESERCGSVFERARAHHRLGRIARERKDPERARLQLALALSAYRRLGVPQTVDVEADLAAVDG